MTIPDRLSTRTVCLLACLVGSGCASDGLSRIPTEPERRAMLALMLPDEIRIWPGTKIASFDDDEVPDGILAIIRPVDPFGDPVKAIGQFYFELWTYQQASGDPKGERLAFWSHSIDSAERVRLHWTHAQMYEFQLGWTEGAQEIKPGRKYLFTATYRTPWDEQIQGQLELDFQLPKGAIQQAATK